MARACTRPAGSGSGFSLVLDGALRWVAAGGVVRTREAAQRRGRGCSRNAGTAIGILALRVGARRRCKSLRKSGRRKIERQRQRTPGQQQQCSFLQSPRDGSLPLCLPMNSNKRPAPHRRDVLGAAPRLSRACTLRETCASRAHNSDRCCARTKAGLLQGDIGSRTDATTLPPASALADASWAALPEPPHHVAGVQVQQPGISAPRACPMLILTV